MISKPISPLGFLAALLIAALAVHGAEVQPLKTTITAGKSHGGTIRGGKAVTYTKAGITVQIQGEGLGDAYAFGNVLAEPIMVEGKKCLPDRDHAKADQKFSFINRTNTLFPHPENGVRVSISYGEIDPEAKTIEAVKGSVEVLVGGVEFEVFVEDLAGRKNGVIDLPDLKQNGHKIEFERTDNDDGMTAVSILMSPKTKMSIAGIELVQGDKTIKDAFVGNGWMMGTYFGQCWIKDEDLKTTKIKLLLRRGWERKVLPFEAKKLAFE